ncbi:hypothetical protein EMIT0P12_11102 [Pseudomonas sp. IT-P12]
MVAPLLRGVSLSQPYPKFSSAPAVCCKSTDGEIIEAPRHVASRSFFRVQPLYCSCAVGR